MKVKQETILLLLILLVGSWLRLHHLGEISFSNDELSALTRARFDSFSELVEKGIKVDGHPALVQTLIWFTIHQFNDDVFTVRIPFAAAGIISIILLFLLAKRWFGSATGLLSAAALATLEFPLLYSQTARPYAIGLMFSLALAYFWTRFLFDEKKNKWTGLAYILASAGCIYSHYFSFMLAGIIGASGLFFIRKENYLHYLLINLIPLLLFIPSVSIFNQQFGYEGIGGWLPPPDSRFLLRFVHYSVSNNHWILWVLFLLIAKFSSSYYDWKSGWKKFHSLSLAWFFLPFLIGYGYSVWKAPVLQFSTLIFSYPFLLIFIFSFINQARVSKKLILAGTLLVLCTGVYSTVIKKNYYEVNHFGVFKELAERTKEWDERYGTDNILKFFSLSNPEYINYYFRRLGHEPAIAICTDREQTKYGALTAMMDTSRAGYFIYAWTNAIHSYETPALIMEKFPVVVARDTFFNSEITLFRKGRADQSENIISITDLETNSWGDEAGRQNSDVSRSGLNSQKMDEHTEYSVSFKMETSKLVLKNNEILKAETWFYAPDSVTRASLVIAFLRNGGLVTYSAAPLQNFFNAKNKWTRVLLFSEPVCKDCELRVYVWNPGREIFYLDDFKISSTVRHDLYRP